MVAQNNQTPSPESEVIHHLSLGHTAFEFIRKGIQTVEGRAPSPGSSDPDKDYEKYSIGDIIVFKDTENSNTLKVKVSRIQHFNSLEEMFAVDWTHSAVPEAKSFSDWELDYYGIPGYEKRIKDNGIWAIGLELVDRKESGARVES